MRISAALIAATFLGSLVPCQALENKEAGDPAVYKVEFEIRGGGDETSQPVQHFSMLIDESRKGVFQATNRIVVSNGSTQSFDVGANIECTVRESDGRAAISGAIDLSSVNGFVNLAAITQPIIGQRRIAFHTTVELGKPVVIGEGVNALAAPVPLGRTDSTAPGSPTQPPAALAQRVEATVTKVN